MNIPINPDPFGFGSLADPKESVEFTNSDDSGVTTAKLNIRPALLQRDFYVGQENNRLLNQGMVDPASGFSSSSIIANQKLVQDSRRLLKLSDFSDSYPKRSSMHARADGMDVNQLGEFTERLEEQHKNNALADQIEIGIQTTMPVREKSTSMYHVQGEVNLPYKMADMSLMHDFLLQTAKAPPLPSYKVSDGDPNDEYFQQELYYPRYRRRQPNNLEAK